MEWWESFFDEEYVQAWTAAGSFVDTDQLVADVDALLDVPSGAHILDVGCGFGRVAGPLAGRGYRVTGIDISPEQLRLAEQRNPGPTYLQADMRRPPPGPFDAAVNLFSSFGYFDDARQDAAALHAWARCLRPGGVLVMELMHRDRVAYLYGQPVDHRTGPLKRGRWTGSPESGPRRGRPGRSSRPSGFASTPSPPWSTCSIRPASTL